MKARLPSSTPDRSPISRTDNRSIIADKIALKLADYVITESGFGADIGMEKFFDIKCRYSGLIPQVVVLVATVRALKMHGGGPKVVAGKPLAPEYTDENLDLLREGPAQPGTAHPERAQVRRERGGGGQLVCHRYPGRSGTGPQGRHRSGRHGCRRLHATGWTAARARSNWPRPSSRLPRSPATSNSSIRWRYPSRKRSRPSARRSTALTAWITLPEAEAKIELYHQAWLRQTADVHGKDPSVLHHDAAIKGAPTGFRVPIRDIRASVGAGFLYPLLGKMRTMPGLPTRPVFYDVDLDLKTGKVVGLF